MVEEIQGQGSLEAERPRVTVHAVGAGTQTRRYGVAPASRCVRPLGRAVLLMCVGGCKTGSAKRLRRLC